MFLYFVIDTSGSMDGAKIGSVNDTMENIISELKLHSNKTDIFVNVLSFARKSKWMFEFPIKIEDFAWETLSASGMTSLGDACNQLAEHIDNNVNDDEIKILLISDGLPTDDYDEGLEKLNNSLSDKNAKRFAIALEGADIITLNKFTEIPDNVFKLESLDNLMNLILSTINISEVNHQMTYNNYDNDEWS